MQIMSGTQPAERNNDDSSTARISLPFKDQVAANAVRKQLRDLSHKIGGVLPNMGYISMCGPKG